MLSFNINHLWKKSPSGIQNTYIYIYVNAIVFILIILTHAVFSKCSNKCRNILRRSAVLHLDFFWLMFYVAVLSIFTYCTVQFFLYTHVRPQ